jgi:hypothetical protein
MLIHAAVQRQSSIRPAHPRVDSSCSMSWRVVTQLYIALAKERRQPTHIDLHLDCPG